MRPPICSICQKKFDPFGKECGLIYFSMRKSDEDWDRHMKETKMIGHPPYAAWFCVDHYKMAKECSNLTIDKALPRIRAYYEKAE